MKLFLSNEGDVASNVEPEQMIIEVNWTPQTEKEKLRKDAIKFFEEHTDGGGVTTALFENETE